MMAAGFAKARALNVDYLWTLDSDVIPDSNNLRCMRDMLKFDDGYYDVAFVPYVAQGGGDFMGGRGNRNAWILPGIYDDEYDIPAELAERIAAHKAARGAGEQSKEWVEQMQKLEGEVRQCPPRENVFGRQSKGWRQRGWLSDAYPGIGRGAAVPSDWMPTGNNLFSRKALALCDFTGYVLGGTQDLYLAFLRLQPAGIRICVVPHCLSHHVCKFRKAGEGEPEYQIAMMYHEPEGEQVGHLRKKFLHWYPFAA